MNNDDIPPFDLQFSYPPEGVEPRKLKLKVYHPDRAEEIKKIIAQYAVESFNMTYDMASEIYRLRIMVADLEHHLWVASWGVE